MSRTSPNDLLLRTESLLFASGHPLTTREITDALALKDGREARTILQDLRRSYTSRLTALEVREIDDKWALQLRPEFVDVVRPVAPAEMTPRTLKALTLIAYHQPIRQSELVRMFGTMAYDEVEKLRAADFIRAEPEGATLLLRTTKRFGEHFGMTATNPDAIRAQLAQRLGLPPPTPSGGVATVESPSSPSAQAPVEKKELMEETKITASPPALPSPP